LFAAFIPWKDLLVSLTGDPISVFIVLDGLDEVLLTYKGTMLDLLRVLISQGESSWSSSGQLFVAKLFLSTRPHFRELIERKFQVAGWSLAPLSFREQVVYLCNYIEASSVKNRASFARAKLQELPETTLPHV